jgi:hypothetical protein
MKLTRRGTSGYLSASKCDVGGIPITWSRYDHTQPCSQSVLATVLDQPHFVSVFTQGGGLVLSEQCFSQRVTPGSRC